MSMTMTIDDLRQCYPARNITCERCGKSFVINSRIGGRTRYCRPCAIEAKRERDRKRFQKIRDEDKASLPKPKKEPLPKRVSHIDDLAAAARAAGMSYGRYKAMMDMKAENF